jgi:chromosome segregation ATPase
LEEKSFENTQRLEEIRVNKETISNNNNLNATMNTNNNNMNNMNYGSNNVTISYLQDAEVEKIKQEQATLKSDNIIFREDINRLTDINHHLENELIEQRNRNIELANENEQLVQEKLKIEKELKIARDTIDKSKMNETSLEQYYNERLMLQNRMRDNENELRKAIEEKSKYEIDFKVLQSRFNELQDKYDKINDEYNNSKQMHDEEFNKIEDKIDKLTREIEKLQGENSGLRQENERQRGEINNLGVQRDNYREKYEEQKNKNDLLSVKIGEIENEFRALQKDKNEEMINRFKNDENKKSRNESKTKIISDLQARIQNYRNQRLMKKQNEENDDF